jgi:signal transduction histidine kinase
MTPPDHKVELDGGQIKQVLLNILLNAIDAAPAGGCVNLAVTPRANLDLPEGGQGVSITITDDGPGFGDTDPAKIFRPFFTTKSSGTGLGLSLCQKIVTAHGGEIRAARRGGLTVFQVLLPGKAAAMTAPETNKEAS